MATDPPHTLDARSEDARKLTHVEIYPLGGEEYGIKLTFDSGEPNYTFAPTLKAALDRVAAYAS